MKRNRLFISTIAADAWDCAQTYGLPVEIAEFCDSGKLDSGFQDADARLQRLLRAHTCGALHAPFSELFPCAVDEKIRRVAQERYCRAVELASRYGAGKLIIHAGFDPHLYFPIWFREKSVSFWKAFLRDIPDSLEICLENVLETQPRMLTEIIEDVGSKRLGICLDIGHANAYSEASPLNWLEECGPYIRHFHIHNNDGKQDLHSALQQGTIDMPAFLEAAAARCPDATFTIEVQEAAGSLHWLKDSGILEEA